MNRLALFGVLMVFVVLVSGCVEEKVDFQPQPPPTWEPADSGVGLASDVADSESLASDLNESELDDVGSDIGLIESQLS